MKIFYTVLSHTDDILKRIKILQSEIDEALNECSGIRRKLFINSKSKLVRAMNALYESRDNLMRINLILKNEKKRKTDNAC